MRDVQQHEQEQVGLAVNRMNGARSCRCHCKQQWLAPTPFLQLISPLRMLSRIICLRHFA